LLILIIEFFLILIKRKLFKQFI